MNNYDLKDCAMLNNNHEDLVYESDRTNDFMAILKGELDSIGKLFVTHYRFKFCL